MERRKFLQGAFAAPATTGWGKHTHHRETAANLVAAGARKAESGSAFPYRGQSFRVYSNDWGPLGRYVRTALRCAPKYDQRVRLDPKRQRPEFSSWSRKAAIWSSTPGPATEPRSPTLPGLTRSWFSMPRPSWWKGATPVGRRTGSCGARTCLPFESQIGAHEQG